jgi:hypothetical protein
LAESSDLLEEEEEAEEAEEEEEEEVKEWEAKEATLLEAWYSWRSRWHWRPAEEESLPEMGNCYLKKNQLPTTLPIASMLSSWHYQLK